LKTHFVFAFAMILGLAGASPLFAAETETYQVFEFSTPKAGQEAGFEHWYTTRHIPEIVRVPGIKTVQRYRIEQSQRSGPPYPTDVLVMSMDTADAHKAATKLASLLSQSGNLLDKGSAMTVVYAPLGAKLPAKDVEGTTAAPEIAGATELKMFHLWAFVNAQQGHEEEFNKGYSEQHFPDVIRNPGIQWGQRFKRADILPATAEFPAYLADYEYSAYDIAAANAEVNRRLAEHITRPIPFPAKGGHTWYAAPIGPVLPGR
jgi:hypothetical protein